MLVGGGWALYALSRHPNNENDTTAAAALARVAPAVEQALAYEGAQLERLGIVIASDPKFFAVLSLPKADRTRTDFKNALENVLREFQRHADTPIFEVMDERGALLARALKPATDSTDLAEAPFVRAAVAGQRGHGYVVEKRNVYRVVTIPVRAGGPILGVLCLGRSVDTEMAGRLKIAMGCDVAFTINDEIQGSTLSPSPLRKILAQRVSEGSLARVGKGKGRRPNRAAADVVDVIVAAGERFVAFRRVLRGPSFGGELAFVLVRPQTTPGSPLAAIRKELLVAGGLGLFLSLFCGTVLAIAAHRRPRRMAQAHQEEIARLMENDRIRSGFIAAASEEISEPTESIRTILDLVEQGALGDLSGPQLEGILSIRNASEELARLGSDLTNLALLDRHQLPLSFEAGDVGELIEHAVAGVVPIASERRQSVTVWVEPGLVHPKIDATALTKAISNIALYAVRQAPNGAQIEVGAQRIEREIRVSVSCSGMGLSNGAPGSNQGRDEERSGLGLAVAAGIAEAHGGSLRISNDPTLGNKFGIDLPFPGAPAATFLNEEDLPLAS